MNLTVKQLADRWQCSIVSVYKLVNSEAIPFFRIGTRGLRFRLEDIEAYESQGASGTVDERKPFSCASKSTEANGPSTTEATQGSLSDARLARMTEQRPNAGLPTGSTFNPFDQLTPRGS